LVVDTVLGVELGTVKTVVDAGYALVTAKYSTDAVAAQYAALLDTLIHCSSRDQAWATPKLTASLVGISEKEGVLEFLDRNTMIEMHGRQLQVECLDKEAEGCSIVVQAVGPPPCATTNWSPKFVQLTMELYERSAYMREGLTVSVKARFAPKPEAPNAGGEAQHPTTVSFKHGMATMQQTLPLGGDSSSAAGVVRYEISMPASVRFHVATVEWRELALE
jgi:hypothetical protein